MFIHTDENIAWKQIRSTRKDLCTYLTTLSEQQWNYQSLCNGWRNRDVVAHLIIEYTYSPTKDWRDFIRSGFNMNTFMKNTAIERGTIPTNELLAQFTAMIDVQSKPSGVSVINVLADLLIHEQDIRIPLGQPRRMPEDAINLVFSSWEPTKFNIGEKIAGVAGVVKGLEFTALDTLQTKGRGIKVEGSAQDIIMTIVGRSTSLDTLKGPGVDLLRKRLNQ